MRNEARTAALRDPARGATSFSGVASISAEVSDRARPPASPERLPAQRREHDKRSVSARIREAAERRSMLRGLLILAALVLLVSLLRAGTGRAFPAGLWR